MYHNTAPFREFDKSVINTAGASELYLFPPAGLRGTLSHRLKSLIISDHPTFILSISPGPRIFNTLEETDIELSQLAIADIGAGIDEIFSYLIS